MVLSLPLIPLYAEFKEGNVGVLTQWLSSVPPEMKGYLHPAMMMMMMAVGAGIVSRRCHLTCFKEHTVRALQTL